MANEEEKKVVETDINKLKGMAKIKNQRIAHILITPTFRCAMICYFVFACVLTLFGIVCYMKATELNDFRFQYDNHCKTYLKTGTICRVPIVPTKTLINPKIYYELKNFYANHRNFVKSRSFKQLRGVDGLTVNQLGKCDPIKQVKDLGQENAYISVGGSKLAPEAPANPCGLIAKYRFNDVFVRLIDQTSGVAIAIDDTNIAHSVDKNYKF